MIQIDEECGVLKILDIAENQLPPVMSAMMIGKQIYSDESTLHEHIYSNEVRDLFNEDDVPQWLDDTLSEIEHLCRKYECPYWRMIDRSIDNI